MDFYLVNSIVGFTSHDTRGSGYVQGELVGPLSRFDPYRGLLLAEEGFHTEREQYGSFEMGWVMQNVQILIRFLIKIVI